MTYQKTAKDIAFDKERTKLRTQINKLKEVIYQKDKEITHLNHTIENLNSEQRNLKDWIERLCDYVNLNEEELKELFENEKKKAESFKMLSNLIQFAGRFPYNF